MSIRYRQTEDGCLFATFDTAPVPDGYERSLSNPRVFLPKLVACERRKYEERKLCKNCIVTVITCNLVKKPVTQGICKDCGANEQWIQDFQKRYG